MTSECYVNDVTITQWYDMSNQKICVFCNPIREPSMIGELHVPVNNNAASLKRRALLFNDNESVINHFNGTSADGSLQVNLSDWINEGSIDFFWHRGLHF